MNCVSAVSRHHHGLTAPLHRGDEMNEVLIRNNSPHLSAHSNVLVVYVVCHACAAAFHVHPTKCARSGLDR